MAARDAGVKTLGVDGFGVYDAARVLSLKLPKWLPTRRRAAGDIVLSLSSELRGRGL